MAHHLLENQTDQEINPTDIAKLALLSEFKQPVTKLRGEKRSPSNSFLLLMTWTPRNILTLPVKERKICALRTVTATGSILRQLGSLTPVPHLIFTALLHWWLLMAS